MTRSLLPLPVHHAHRIVELWIPASGVRQPFGKQGDPRPVSIADHKKHPLLGT